MFSIFIAIGFILRGVLIPMAGFKADMAFWKGWGLAVADHGVLWLAANTNYNYPPAFMYVLYLVNKIYAFFQNPYQTSYWLDTNTFYLFLIKSITVISDIVIVYLIIQIARVLKNPHGKILALIYFFNPIVILDGVIWGQVDSFGLLWFVLTIYMILKDKPALGTGFFTIGFLMKFQNIIFLPLFFLYLFKKYPLSSVVRYIAISVGVFLLSIFPFLLAKQSESVIRLFTQNADWFPWYSLNAFNMWWVAAAGAGMSISDKTLVFGIMNAKETGLLLFASAYFVIFYFILDAKKEELLQKFMIGCGAATLAFFHLLTESHERYLFHLLVIIPIIYLLTKIDIRKSRTKLFIIAVFFNFTLIFLNIYLSLWFNYPDQAPWPLSASVTRYVTLGISLLQIVFFIVYLLTFFRVFLWRNRWIFTLIVFVLASCVLIKNNDYFFRRPISITKLKSSYHRQDYLKPMTNMSVESDRGPSYWNRLSNNYFFYEKGIGTHADSDIAYLLGGKFRRFKAQVGLDTEAGADSKVVFLVSGDGNTLYKSRELGRFDMPEEIAIDISGVNELVLKVRRVGASNAGDHADWFEPVVIR